MRELVGNITVDSGIVMVGDPCYTLSDNAAERDAVAKNWGAFCRALDAGASKTHNDVYHPFPRKAAALVVNAGYGDGTYPVYVEYEADSIWGQRRIKNITIEFIGAEND